MVTFHGQKNFYANFCVARFMKKPTQEVYMKPCFMAPLMFHSNMIH